jgi:hypothetical protein
MPRGASPLDRCQRHDWHSNGALFSVIGGRALPPNDVQIRVELANSTQMTVQPHAAMWLVIVQRCGDYDATAIRSVELLATDNSLIERKVLEPLAKTPPTSDGSRSLGQPSRRRALRASTCSAGFSMSQSHCTSAAEVQALLRKCSRR